MTNEHVLAFVSFSTVLAITPGPGNTLLTATGASVGVLRGLPAVVGFAVGMALMMFVVTFGVGSIILANPVVMTVVKWSGAAVICWLAWKIASARIHRTEARGRPIGFFGAAAFQWINPKSWLAVTSAAATFLDPNRGSASLQALMLAVIFAAVTLPCCSVWLAFGALAQRTLRSERAHRIFNFAMGALLAASVALFIV
jgi:threonine/homoserine/homoserine lactone efflux protein